MSSDDRVDTLEYLREVAKFKEAKSVEEMLVILVDSARRSGHLDEAGTSSYGETKILVEGAIARLAELSGGSMTAGGPRYQFPDGFEILGEVYPYDQEHYQLENQKGEVIRQSPALCGFGDSENLHNWRKLANKLEIGVEREWGFRPKIKIVKVRRVTVGAQKREEIQ
ncbi:hypothetical protein SEA_MADI_86 [Gordonia phage Madi]|uniref:Uncharacterized protein n=1 Tax=Gordonia phage Sienna TaxID=2759396 RepID=A0A7L7SII8_9CAUD|nr:hypothetical protein SEA_SIENNA_87 [Gordonia phage Sienna]QYW00889.1 hypothetical protein SEA_MADI_86 [Gordonia phage Madi]